MDVGPAEKLIFLHEAGVNTKMTSLYGRALRGERCHDQVPYGHWLHVSSSFEI